MRSFGNGSALKPTSTSARQRDASGRPFSD
jgi:hypothetical protein